MSTHGPVTKARLESSAESDARTYVGALARLAEKWRLTDDDMARLVGVGSRRTWSRWKQAHGASFNQDQLMRASLLIGMYKALQILFSKPLADLWPTRPNGGALFGGAPPVEVMKSGGIPAMFAVRQHLEGLSGGM